MPNTQYCHLKNKNILCPAPLIPCRQNIRSGSCWTPSPRTHAPLREYCFEVLSRSCWVLCDALRNISRPSKIICTLGSWTIVPLFCFLANMCLVRVRLKTSSCVCMCEVDVPTRFTAAAELPFRGIDLCPYGLSPWVF